MKFCELKTVINRCSGRHDKIAITIGLGTDAVIEAESPLLDCLVHIGRDDLSTDEQFVTALGNAINGAFVLRRGEDE